jgi:UDP-glucose:(heptosyl)LPS alpha-1,3-glucosyltransferase
MLRTRMHVAFVIFRAEPGRGGAERYVDQLGHALVGRRHRVSVLASKLGDVGELEGVKISAAGITRTARYRRFLSNLERHLHAHKYDVVHACLPVKHCDVYHAHAGLEATSLRESHRIKSTLAGQATSMLGSKINRKRRAFARVEASLLNGPNPPITICLSDRERSIAERLFPSARGKLVTLHSAPDDAKFVSDDLPKRRERARKQLGVGADQTVFLFVGQDFRRKGLATAIRALGQLRDPHAVLYIVGGGDIAPYSKAAVQADVCGRVLFAGSTTDISPFLAAADGLVLPSRYEPFGMVAVEAMLMGVPPIVSGVSGASEVIAEDRTGYIVADPSDVAGFAAAMRKICDRSTRERLSAACLAERARFSYSAHVDAIEAIHRRAAAGRVLGTER